MTYTDVMIDLETTGILPDRHGIIQLSAVRFNIDTEEVDTSFFNKCLMVPPTRSWDEGTRTWWFQRKDTLRSILARSEHHVDVLKDFLEWFQVVPTADRFWSKPSHFDYNFLQSYFKDAELNFPFPHYKATDMRSYIRGLYRDTNYRDPNLSFDGVEHDAIYDALHQLKLLFWHKENSRNDR